MIILLILITVCCAPLTYSMNNIITQHDLAAGLCSINTSYTPTNCAEFGNFSILDYQEPYQYTWLNPELNKDEIVVDFQTKKYSISQVFIKENDLRCPVDNCKKSYQHFSVLVVHADKIHGVDICLRCLRCNYTFKNSRDISPHKKSCLNRFINNMQKSSHHI